MASFIQYSQFKNRMHVVKFVHVARLVYTICRTQASGRAPTIPTTYRLQVITVINMVWCYDCVDACALASVQCTYIIRMACA